MQDTTVSQSDEMAAAVVESSARLLTERRGKPQPPAQALKCPRCESMNTKFCYYNNYNLSQPRHFCKNCRRYWTKGGSLRNVPVGGGCRKNKRSSKHKSSGGDQRNHNNLAEKAAASKAVSSSDKVGGGGSSSSSSLVNNNNVQEGSDRSECNTNSNNNTHNNNSSSSAVSNAVFHTDLHQQQLLNSGNSISSVSYENPQFSVNPAVFSGSVNWSRISPLDIQWKQQQSLTSLLTDGRASFDGSAIAEPPPLLEDITSIGEAAISRFLKATPASWPSLLQDQQNSNNNQSHAFDWQTNGSINLSNNSEASFLSDLGPWGGGNWPDLSNYGPGSSLP